ncbi:signal peptidase I [Homoserinibacter sp. YIM 151385]|uniref:signal peptidase I n=1 Tax=Homoserinibacter sp. YIM 151385 TaxID=2985506 RepID=UPI0022F00494|nr:signal peptidase I [Homoserinibacter sp. YIM 151385]WBU37019.1 signal peptidase I [Homoserinibacter sp. YIM 151385]
MLAWGRFAAVVAARALLAAIAGLAFWAAAPMVLGWHSTTVMTGSMEPALQVGDVVVSKPVEAHELRPGQVLLFPDADHPGTLRLHRFDAIDDDGGLITKGDANVAADSTRIDRGTVSGVGYLRVPLIGTPAVWISEHRTAPLVALGAGLLLLAAVAVVPAVAGGDAGEPAPRRGRHRRRRRLARPLPLGVAATAVVIAILAVPAPAAAAAFSAATASASTISTAAATPATGLTCTNNADGSVTVGWKYAGARPERFTTIVDGTPGAAVDGAARSTILSPEGLFSWRTSTVSIRTDLTSTWTTASTGSVKITTVRFLGFGRTTCAA